MSDFSVMMLTWEFPPRVIGGIAPHVNELSRALSRIGVKVYVVTCDFPGAPEHETIEGVEVFRVDSYRFPTPDFATWTSMMNLNLLVAATDLLKKNREEIRILHAHDWLVANVSIGLKHLFRAPLVTTIHSTEFGRRNGLHTDYHRMIHSVEVWLTHEAWRVICCSKYMASQVIQTLGTRQDNVDVVPNGVDTSKFSGSFDPEGFRSRFATPNERLVLFVGRLVFEKGAQLLVEAIPHVLKGLDAKFVIVGEGHMKEQLIDRMGKLGVGSKTFITGFLDGPTVLNLFRVADVVVVPSIYEPFGIVALEAMAARTPVVTTGGGGLGEIVEHEVSGLTVYPTPESIAGGILRILRDAKYAERLADNSYKKVAEKFNWQAIAERTKSVYERIIGEYDGGDWKPQAIPYLPKFLNHGKSSSR